MLGLGGELTDGEVPGEEVVGVAGGVAVAAGVGVGDWGPGTVRKAGEFG